jgi:hypothetical protein
MKLLSATLCWMLSAHSAFGFMLSQQQSTASPLMMTGTPADGDSRRDFMTKTVATALTIAGSGVLAPNPAHAVKGADKVNAMLKA